MYFERTWVPVSKRLAPNFASMFSDDFRGSRSSFKFT